MQKRVLLLEADPLLAELYTDCLKNEDFAIEAAHDEAAAASKISEEDFDAVVLDLITPSSESAFFKMLRREERLRRLPVIVLPATVNLLNSLELTFGSVTVLPRGVNPIAEILDALQTSLSLHRTALSDKALPLRCPHSWMQASHAASASAVTSMRRVLHGVSRDTGDSAALRELFRLMHGFAEKMALLEHHPQFAIGGAAERLIFDLLNSPPAPSSPALRTISQALDFLAVLVSKRPDTKLCDPASATVLVVDDEEGARKVIESAAALVGLRSIPAESPAQALASLGTHNFELIFLDVTLPEMTGFELCTRIRGFVQHQKTPIVFLTGMTAFQNRVQSSLSGGHDFISKPFSISELGLKALLWVFKGQLGMA